MRTAVGLELADPSQVSAARRQAAILSEEIGLGERDAGRVSLIVTESATNVLKHANGGEMILSVLREGDRCGLQILTLDKGRGFDDFSARLRDGFSTAGSPGTGLGAIVRLSSVFDIYSRAGRGTGVLAQVWPERDERPQPPLLSIGGFSLPMPGESECGDRWATSCGDDRVLILVADGLGHGPDAARASRVATATFAQVHDRPLPAIIEAVHNALRPTRGAAVAVCEVRPRRGVVCFAGVGNISATVVSRLGVRHLVSHNGTAGHEARRIQEFTYPWPEDPLLVLASDGLGTRWDLSAYPGLESRHPALISGMLYRDFTRGRDDCTVVCARPPDASAENPS